MAFEDRVGGKYFTILGGKFCIRTSADTPGAVERVNKEGNTVHEIFHDSFNGKLLNIRHRTEGKYGPSLEFDFRDNEEVYTLQLSASNSYATNILKILPNADLTQEMKLQPDQKIVDGKAKSSIFISQNGKTLKHAYTKENPGGMPPMEQITVKGQLVWDDTKRLAFLIDMMERDILPKLPKDATAPAAQDAPASEDEDF